MQLDRWGILAVLFVVRCSMGLQFQVVPALSPLFLSTYGVSIADLGLLIGLYYVPGVALAYPGGAIGRRFGDKSTVLAGLALMIAGGLIMALLPSWHAQLAGRLLAGAGGILLNVLMSKMVADWFASKEIATAMGIFVNSWPVGIALGLLVYPSLAKYAGLTGALLALVVYLAAGFALLWVAYKSPADLVAQAAVAQRAPEGLTLAAVLVAGAVWGTYNAALAMVFAFGPLILSERGWSVVAASSTTSLTLWLVALSVPAGGIIADWLGRHIGVLMAGVVVFAIALLAAPRMASPALGFIAIGLLGGISAGPIMSLPARVLRPETRAIGMGLFFTVFYVCQAAAPWFAGTLATLSGSTSITFDFGAILLAVCGGLVGVFLVITTIERGRARA